MEISSKGDLREADLTRTYVKGGHLLLDPKNITINNNFDTGLDAEDHSGYFADNFSSTVFNTTNSLYDGDVTSINFSSLGDSYTVQWRGYYLARTSGTHTFETSSDDSSWLWVMDYDNSDIKDGFSDLLGLRSSSNEVVDNSGLHGTVTRSGTVSLDAHEYHPILIYFGENTGGDNMRVRHTVPGGSATTDGSGFFFNAGNEYGAGTLSDYASVTGTAVTRASSYTNNQSGTSALDNNIISNMLAAGTNVVLRASNDITLNGAISAPTSNSSTFVMQAGRDITVNADITTNNGNLTMRANGGTGLGVINAQRDAGNADITNNATINAGSGNINVIMDSGGGITNAAYGDISLGNMTGGSITVQTVGTPNQGTISSGTLNASGTGSSAISIEGYEIGNLTLNNTGSGNWKVYRLRSDTDNDFTGVPTADFIQYGYSDGDSLLGSGDGIMSGYDPGAVTYSYANISGQSYKANKTYDGTTSTATATFGTASLTSANGLSSSVNATLSGATLTYDDANFNNNSKTITGSGAWTVTSPTHTRHNTVYGLTGGTQTITGTRISKASVAVTLSKDYDGTTTANGSDSPTFSGLQGSDDLTLTGASATSSANVGNYTSISQGTLSLADGSSGLASNYSIASNAFNMNITQTAVTLSGTKQYDATGVFTGATDISITSGLIGSETLGFSGTVTLNDSKVQSYTASDITSVTLGLTDGTNGGLASNYTLGTPTFTITQRVLSSTGSRQYDATTTAANADQTLSGLQGGETLTLGGSGTVASANVGTGKTITLGSLALSNGTGTASNYTLTGGTHTLDVTQRVLSSTGSRQYDATTTAANADQTLSGLQGGETLTLGGSGTVASANVGTGKTITLGSLALSNGTGTASNYTLTGGTHTLDVTQRVLSSTGSRQYDATTTAANADQTLSGLQGGETLTLGGSGTVASANVGTGKTITLGSLALSNGTGTASNYTLTGGTHTLDVTQRVLSSTGSRQYDATTTAANADQTLSGLQGGETLTLGGSGTVASANVGTGKTITLGSLALSNGTGTASNYTLTGGTHTLDIIQKILSSSGSRIYDGTTDASNSDLTLTGLVGTETLNLGGAGTLGSANVGANQAFALGTLSISDGTNGGLAANYTLTGGTHVLTINQKVVNLTGSKVYDANTNASATDLSVDVSTLVGSETLTLGGTTTGTLSSANVGTRTIGSNASGINLGDGTNGGLAANYTLTGGSHQITITQRGVTANFTRTYDGTTVVSASDLTNFTGLQGSDDLTITGTGTGGPNVGNSQSVTLGTLTIGDGSTGLASNYGLSSGSLNINPAQVSLSGSRQYDSTALFTGETDLFVSGGTIGSQTLVVNGTVTLNSGNVGTYGIADISVPAITLGDGTNGGLASNYTLGTPTFTITQRVLSSTGSRQYDATTTAANADQTLSGLQGGETLTLGGSGTVASANVGTGKTITLGSLALSNGTGTASNYTLTGGTHTLDVTQRVLSSTGSRQYDATTTAANADQTLSGLQGGETLTLGGSGTVASANVGTGKTITLGSLALSNGTGTASNYTLTGGTHTLDVTQRVLSSTGSRQYDATTTAANADQTLSGLQGGETLTLGGSGTVASANVGTGKTITLGSLALSNGTGTASNYTLTGGTHTLDVTQRVLSSTGSRQYDATNSG